MANVKCYIYMKYLKQFKPRTLLIKYNYNIVLSIFLEKSHQ